MAEIEGTAAPETTTDTAAPVTDTEKTIEQVIKEAQELYPSEEAELETEEAPEAQDPGGKTKPKPKNGDKKEPKVFKPPPKPEEEEEEKIQSAGQRFAARRIAQRKAREEQEAQVQARNQEFEARERQLREAERVTQSRFLEYKELIKKGDVDGALKSLDLGSLQELQAAHLRAKGIAVPQVDPATKAKLEQLEQYEQQRQAEAKQRQQYIEEQRQAAEQAKVHEDLKADVVESGYEGAAELVELPGFLNILSGQLAEVDSDDVDFEAIVEQTAQRYLPVAERLLKIFPHLRSTPDPAQSSAEAQKRAAKRGLTAGIPQSQSTGERIPPTKVAGGKVTSSELDAIIREAKRLYPSN